VRLCTKSFSSYNLFRLKDEKISVERMPKGKGSFEADQALQNLWQHSMSLVLELLPFFLFASITLILLLRLSILVEEDSLFLRPKKNYVVLVILTSEHPELIVPEQLNNHQHPSRRVKVMHQNFGNSCFFS